MNRSFIFFVLLFMLETNINMGDAVIKKLTKWAKEKIFSGLQYLNPAKLLENVNGGRFLQNPIANKYIPVPEGGKAKTCEMKPPLTRILSKKVSTATNPLKLIDYDVAQKVIRMAHIGHTVEMKLGHGQPVPEIIDGHTGEKYAFHSMYFFWEHSHADASEFTINGHTYAIELRIIHVNKKYKTIEKAEAQPNGIAVVVILIQTHYYKRENYLWKMLFDSLEHMTSKNSATDVTVDGPLYDLLFPEYQVHSTYCYKASMKAPYCSDSVKWFVMAHSVDINKEQIEKLNAIFDTVPMTSHFTKAEYTRGIQQCLVEARKPERSKQHKPK